MNQEHGILNFRGLLLNRIHFWSNLWISGYYRNTLFFILGDPKNNFSTEKIPQNFQLLEGHTLILLKLFESSCIVLEISRVDSAQKCPFWTCQTPEQLLRSKSCRSMTPVLPISVAVTKDPILIYIFGKFILHIKRYG